MMLGGAPRPGGLGEGFKRTADTVWIHVGLQGLIDFNGFDNVGRNGVQFNLADAGFRRRNSHAVNCQVGEARLSAANLDVFAFTFVTLDGDAGQAAEGISHVRIGQATNHIRGKNLNDVVGGDLAVDGLGFAGSALGSNGNLEGLRLNLELRVRVRGLTGSCGGSVPRGVANKRTKRYGAASG